MCFMKEKFKKINTIEELFNFMDNISYGWHGSDNITRIDSLNGFKDYYRTMSIEDVFKHKVGTCNEQVNLIKTFLDSKKIENKIYVIVGYETIKGIDKERVHFMIVYKIGEEWYQMEHASRFFRGIFKYGTLKNAKNMILDRYKCILKDSIIIEIDSIPIGINYSDLRKIILKNIK